MTLSHLNFQDQIILKDLEIFMYLGLHDYEKATRQRVLLSFWIDIEVGATEDGGILDYDELRDFCLDHFAGQRIETQEELCRILLKRIMKFPQVSHATVQSKKPDVFKDAGYVSLKVEATRNTPEDDLINQTLVSG